MYIDNDSQFDDTTVHAVVEFCAKHVGANMNGIVVEVRDDPKGHAYNGRAYQRIPPKHRHAHRGHGLVKVHVGPPDMFPVRNLLYRTTLLPWGTTKEEATRRMAKIDPRWKPRLKRRWGTINDHQYRWMITTVQPYGGKRAPVVTANSPMEALVYVMAHELVHIVQFQNHLRLSEVQCDRGGYAVLEMYRRLGLDTSRMASGY